MILGVSELTPLGTYKDKSGSGPGNQLYLMLHELARITGESILIFSKTREKSSYKVKKGQITNFKIGTRFKILSGIKFTLFTLYNTILIMKKRNERFKFCYVSPPFWGVIIGLVLKYFYRIPLIIKIASPSTYYIMSKDYDIYQKKMIEKSSPRTKGANLLFLILKRLFINLTKFADLLQVLTRNQYNELLFRNFKPKKLKLIPNGIHTKTEHKTRKKSVDENFIMYVGRIELSKGVLTLLDAYKFLMKNSMKNLPDLKIIGTGSFNIEKRIRELSSEKRKKIEITGSLPQKKIGDFYKNCFAFILPSFGEGISNSLLEALSHGKPVIASSSVGNIDVIEHKKNGLLFKVGDHEDLAMKIDFLIKYPEYRAKLGREGKRLIQERFAIDIVAENLLKNIIRLSNSVQDRE